MLDNPLAAMHRLPIADFSVWAFVHCFALVLASPWRYAPYELGWMYCSFEWVSGHHPDCFPLEKLRNTLYPMP